MKPRTTLTEDARRRLDFVRGADPAKETPPEKPSPAEDAPREEPIVNQAYRLPKSLVNRLRQIVTNRKNNGVQPWSANAIAIEALTEWVEREEKRASPK